MGEAGNEETAELRVLAAPTQQLPALIPALSHASPDAPADEPPLTRRWRWPLLALATAALASIPIALFATSDSPNARQQMVPPQWPPAPTMMESTPALPSPPEESVALVAPPPPAAEVPRHLSASATPSPSPTAPAPGSYEAEAPGNRLGGRAATREVATASGGSVVGWVGDHRDNTLTFTDVTVPAAGRYRVTVHYLTEERRAAAVEANGRFAQIVDFPSTGGWDRVGTITVTLTLRAGENTIEFGNRYSWAPDFDRLVVEPSAG
ncbi:hypothetical protein [Phytohabitans kaempferiae]|uniref:CBM6 domain-containing protein n=1 Tax=Phytohabitans kaempferiae TaxID=1620943 RepID=A0ABV6M925_9ACTN